jgi:cytochrome c oxidase subunit 2
MQTWIRDAQSVKPGNLMPPFPALSDADLKAVVAYLESLK